MILKEHWPIETDGKRQSPESLLSKELDDEISTTKADLLTKLKRDNPLAVLRKRLEIPKKQTLLNKYVNVMIIF